MTQRQFIPFKSPSPAALKEDPDSVTEAPEAVEKPEVQAEVTLSLFKVELAMLILAMKALEQTGARNVINCGLQQQTANIEMLVTVNNLRQKLESV